MPEEQTDDNRLGTADPSTESNPEAAGAETPEGAKPSLEQNKGNEATEPVPFHKHPRFVELVNEKNQLKMQLSELHSKMAGEQQPKIDPVEKIVKRYVQAGMKEDAARLIAQGQVDLNREIVKEEVAPLQREAIATKNQLTFSKFAESHKDFKDVAPQMDEIYRGMSSDEQAWVSGNARGLEYLYNQAKDSETIRQAEIEKAFKKGVQEGYTKKQEKSAIAPSTGASTGSAKGTYSEKDISEMSLEEYSAHRKEILASRGVR